MKLTRRQLDFCRALLRMYQREEQPLHYADLASRLGVSRFTAYDMLRLLEEKGMVRSEYRLSSGRSGPGRSEIVFLPTEAAHRLLAQLGGTPGEEGIEGVEGIDWEGWHENLLQQALHSDLVEPDLMGQLLARIPTDDPQPLRYCIEVITIIALRLKRGAGRRLLWEFFPDILTTVPSVDPQDLTFFGGFALGVLVRENASDYAWCKELLAHTHRYGALVASMSPEQQQRLAEVLCEMYESFSVHTPAGRPDALPME